MKRSFGLCLCVAALALAGCAPSYSPHSYSSGAVQQVNKVEPGVIVGFRQVKITASGTVGAVTGGAAGGVLGSRSEVYGVDSALGVVGGTAVGTILGTTIEHATADTVGWEYIVRKGSGEMVSVTQREEAPLALGQKVLVIAGAQARIVPDYSVEIAEPKPEPKPEAKPAEPATAAPTLVPETHRIAKPAAPPLLVVPLSSDYAVAPPAAPEAPVAAAPEPEPAPAPAPEPAPETAATPEPAPAAAPEPAAEAEPRPPETAEAK